jgi:hypothetical protein
MDSLVGRDDVLGPAIVSSDPREVYETACPAALQLTGVAAADADRLSVPADAEPQAVLIKGRLASAYR